MQTVTPFEQIEDNIFRIRVPLPDNPLQQLNSYFISGSDHNLLIDTGFNLKECYDALTKGLEALHADMSKTDLFLTHLHSDHCGLAPAIVKSGRHVYISETDLKYLNDSAYLTKITNAMYDGMGAAGVTDQMRDAMFDFNPSIEYAPGTDQIAYDSVRDGDTIDVGGYHFRCILTPGHTPGEMCLWEESRRILILGDHVLFDITPNITAWPDVEDSLGDYLESLHLVEDLDVRLALPGHREIGEFRPRIAELYRHHETRLEKCREALRKKPDSTLYEVASQINWKIRVSSWEEFPATQLFFALGESQAHLDHLRKLGEISVMRDDDGTDRYRIL